MGRCAPELEVHIKVKRPALMDDSSRMWLSPRQDVMCLPSVFRNDTVTTGSRLTPPTLGELTHL